jgi:hypothetical protein
MAYEYALLTQPLKIDWSGEPPEHAEAMLGAWRQIEPELLATLGAMDGGDWEIVSHDVLQVENGAVMSLVVRRESI